MSETIDNISFSERQYMQKILDFIDSMVIKSDFDAEENETLEMKRAGEKYVLAVQKKDSLFDYFTDLSTQFIRKAGISVTKANLFTTNKEAFFNSLTGSETEELLEFLREWRISNYVELNPYYLILNGEPTSEDEIVYVKDIFDGGEIPIHKYSNTYHATMYQYLTNYNYEKMNEIIDELKSAGKTYEYLDHLANRIDYATARSAKNFQILYYNGSILNAQDMHNFFNEYARSADYVQTVPYIQAYGKTEELYDRFMIITILFMTLENFLSLKLDAMMRHKFSTREEKILFFKDYDMESIVSSLTDSQMDILIENMDHLIPLKGSEEVITKILDLFGIENIDVYKYMLFKTIKSNSLTREVDVDPTKPRSENYEIDMIRVPINTNEDAQTAAKYINDPSMHIDPKTIMLNDKYFGNNASEETQDSSDKEAYYNEVIDKLKNTEEFSYFYTKYIGIISHINITQALIKATYLFQQLFHDPESLDLICTTDLPAELSCRDLIAAINYVITLRYDMSDEIMTDVPTTARIMGFNSNPDLNALREIDDYIIKSGSNNGEVVNVQLKDMIDDDEIFIVRNSAQIETQNDFNTGSLITLMATSAVSASNKARCTTDYEFNMKRLETLAEKLENCKDYKEYRALQKIYDYNMYTLSALQMFEGYTTYSQYLQTKTPELYTYIIDALNSATNSIWNSSDGESRSSEFINECIDLVSIFVESILQAIGTDDDVNDAVVNTYVDNTSAFAKIFAIINLFKSYTVQFSNTDVTYTVNNPRDCMVKVFSMINAENMGDYYRESIAELVYHSITESSHQTGITLIKLREWLTQYTSEEVANRIELEHDLKITGKTGKWFDDILLHHAVSDRVSVVTGHRLKLKNYLYSIMSDNRESKISIDDGGLFGNYRFDESRELVRYKPDTPSSVKHLVNLNHELQSIGELLGASRIEVRHHLVEN